MSDASQPISQNILSLDNALFDLVKGINILDAIGPLNYRQQRDEFFEAQYSKSPDFAYAAHSIDPFFKKRALFALPVEQVEDEDLRNLYIDVISSYIDKIDLYKSIGTPEFLYDSLRHFGEPSEKDIRNANFILHLPDDVDDEHDNYLSAADIQQELERFAQHQGYDYQIRLDDSMIANALVSGTLVKINSSAQISPTEVQALAHHELGVHLVTTLNARSQPLKLLAIGCPLNTMTQEGMAILSEYLAGYLTLSRLKMLAMRVLAVNSMINEKDFRRTFLFLKEQYKVPDDKAFTITARVYRGGGFTKDYLYLQGFHQMLNAYEQSKDFNQLLSGKVSLDYLPTMTRLIEKGYFQPPKWITPSFSAPQVNDSIKQFIAHTIK